jgi:hypothetical protein
MIAATTEVLSFVTRNESGYSVRLDGPNIFTKLPRHSTHTVAGNSNLFLLFTDTLLNWRDPLGRLSPLSPKTLLNWSVNRDPIVFDTDGSVIPVEELSNHLKPGTLCMVEVTPRV